MEERYALAGGRGWLRVREEGGRAICQAEMEDDHRGLYKVWLLHGERRMLLGAMIPEKGKLRLSRALSLDDLYHRKLWPPSGGAAELTYAARREEIRETQPPAGWVRERCPGRLLGDRLLARSAQQLSGVLLKKTRSGFHLALPYASGRAFGLTPLFCFARPATLDGETYMIFSFNEQGCPIFPHKDESPGETNGVIQKKE